MRNLAVGANTSAALQKIALTPKEISNFNVSTPEIFFGLRISDIHENKYLYELSLETIDSNTLTVKQEYLYNCQTMKIKI